MILSRRYAFVVLLAGCANTVSPSAAVDAAAADVVDVPDVIHSIIVPDVAGACRGARSCVGTMVPPEVLRGTCDALADGFAFSARSIGISLCNCLHGAGPGVDGSATFSFTNLSSHSMQIGRDVAFTFRRADRSTLELGACCGQSVGRSYICAGEPAGQPWGGIVPPGAVDVLAATIHVDAPMAVAGVYEVLLGITVDGVMQTLDLGSVNLAFPVH